MRKRFFLSFILLVFLLVPSCNIFAPHSTQEIKIVKEEITKECRAGAWHTRGDRLYLGGSIKIDGVDIIFKNTEFFPLSNNMIEYNPSALSIQSGESIPKERILEELEKIRQEPYLRPGLTLKKLVYTYSKPFKINGYTYSIGYFERIFSPTRYVEKAKTDLQVAENPEFIVHTPAKDTINFLYSPGMRIEYDKERNTVKITHGRITCNAIVFPGT